MLHVQELGDPPLESERQGGIADERGRSRAVNAELLDRRNGDIANLGMRSQAQIILGGEIDAFEEGALIRARQTLAPGAGLGRPAERPETRLAAKLLPLEESLDPIQKVGAGKIAEITHAPAECRQPILWVAHLMSSRR